MSTKTNSEMIFSSDIIPIITSHIYEEDVTIVCILSQVNKSIKNDIIYIEEKNDYIDDRNFENLIKNTEMYCKSNTFEEKVEKAKKIDKFTLLIKNIPSNSWFIEDLERQISDLYYDFSSNEGDRWFPRTIAEYGTEHIYYIQHVVQILYQILLQISPGYRVRILDKNLYKYDIDGTCIDSVERWLLEGEELDEEDYDPGPHVYEV
jgi:hypothetical protein